MTAQTLQQKTDAFAASLAEAGGVVVQVQLTKGGTTVQAISKAEAKAEAKPVETPKAP